MLYGFGNDFLVTRPKSTVHERKKKLTLPLLKTCSVKDTAKEWEIQTGRKIFQTHDKGCIQNIQRTVKTQEYKQLN